MTDQRSPASSSYLDGLNESQRRAVMEIDGPLLIVAGPGTGKTLTMVRRMARLVSAGVKPERILAVTFTNRAAREMQERAHALLGDEARRICIGTFHLLGLRIVRAARGAFTLLDRDEQIALLRELTGKSAKASAEILERISRSKNLLQDPDADLDGPATAYHQALEQRNALDFDDLIRLPVSMFESGAVPAAFQDRFSHIIVDEYQDINPAQYQLLKQLLSTSRNICVVGDSDQAIYAFRGADITNFLNFEKDFSNSRTLHLDQTYRSTATIFAAADSVISSNSARIVKDIHPVREQGGAIRILSVPDEKAEAETIIAEIEARMGGTSRYRHYRGNDGASPDRAFSFSDFAVICRTNAQLRIIEDALRAAGLPCQVIGRKSARQQQEIEETLAFLRSVARVSDDDAGEGGTPEEKLLAPADYYDPRAEAVALMTMHMAKGLEFSVVFIAGCEDGLTPYTERREGESDIEEERRLFYVGMTRARDELVLLHARKRFLYGQSRSPRPSPFLADIQSDLVVKTTIPDRIKKQREQDKQLGLF